MALLTLCGVGNAQVSGLSIGYCSGQLGANPSGYTSTTKGDHVSAAIFVPADQVGVYAGNHIDEIKGIYIPFWLFDAVAEEELSGTALLSDREIWCAARGLALMQEYAESRGAQFLFTVPCGGYEAWNLTGYLGTYCHGNQPGHSIPFAYYFINRQEKAQHVLNTLMHDYYGMGSDHLAYAGMDDAGEMSSWYVLNAIGIYTYSPADPAYLVTVPLFDRTDFTLGTTGKTFSILRNGTGKKIAKILVGNKPLKGWFVNHKDLAEGCQLTIETYFNR